MPSLDKFFPSKFLKVADLDGEDISYTIKRIVTESVGMPGQEEMKPVAYFEEIDKGLVLNKTNCESIASVTKSRDIDDWPGQMITLYETETTFQGKPIMCIRVRLRAPKAVKPVAKPAKFTAEVNLDSDEVPF